MTTTTSSRGLSGTQMEVVDSVDQAGRFMTWLSERHEDNVIAVDTETGERPGNPREDAFSPWHGRLRLAQVGDTMTGWAIPWDGWNGVFHEAMAKWEGTYACHNISFEHKWFEIQSGFRTPWHRAVDTMIAQQVVNPAESAALKRLTSKYLDPKAAALQSLLDEEMTKNGWTWGTIPITNKKYLAYGAMDCILTSRLWVDHLKGLVSPYQQIFDMEMAVRRIASIMEINGSRVDVDYCRGQYALLNDHARKVNVWIQDQYGIKNPSSGAQLIRAFSSMGGVWDPESRTPSGAPRIDKGQLKIFSNHSDQRISVLAQAVLDMRKSDKLANTYFTNFIEMQEDGLLHPQINTMAARTSRMSIRNPALQTLSKGEKRVRNAFIPRQDDHSLITSDLDQVEFRMLAHFAAKAGDYALSDMFKRCDATGVDSFTEILRELYHDPAATKKDARRKLVKGYVYSCVPLSTKILTEDGWLSHEQVEVGNRTLGVDPQTGKMGWTRITEVHKYDDARVYTFGDGVTDFRCTDEHRWLNGTFKRAENPDDPKWGLTKSWQVELNGKDEPRAVVPLNGRLGTGSIKVPQVKIRELLSDLVRRESPEYVWETALALKSSARKALLAELDDRYGVRKDGVSVAYSTDMEIVGEIAQALAFVTGKVTTTRETTVGDGEVVAVTTVKSAYPRASSMKLSEKSTNEPVWCVTTEFGTWTMREPGGTAVITGNSSYGAGVEKMAEITGVPASEMKGVSDAFDRQYPGKKLFTQQTEDEAMRNLRGTGRAYVDNWLGRVLPVDDDKIYTGVNYKIQSGAADIFKINLLKLDAAGLTDYMVVPVHDEIVLSVPTKEAEDLKREVQKCMTTVDGWTVPLTADSDGPFDRWGDAIED